MEQVSCTEGSTTTAAFLGVRILELKTTSHEIGGVVQDRSIQENIAFLIDNQLDPLALEDLVVLPRGLFKTHTVRKPGTAPALDRHAEHRGGPVLLFHLVAECLRRSLGQFNHRSFPYAVYPCVFLR